jgi:hypothetical protein
VTQPLHASQHIKILGNTRIAYKPRHTHTPLNTRSQKKPRWLISDTATHKPQHAKREGFRPWEILEKFAIALDI